MELNKDLDVMFNDLMKNFEKIQTKKHILAVDDDRSVLKLLKEVLMEDYEITSMANGKMAQKYLETKTADLILLDYEMPDISGADVLKKIRSDSRTAKIPVIFLTGVSDSSKVKEVLAHNPSGYLLKPVDVERLKQTIKKLIG